MCARAVRRPRTLDTLSCDSKSRGRDCHGPFPSLLSATCDGCTQLPSAARQPLSAAPTMTLTLTIERSDVVWSISRRTPACGCHGAPAVAPCLIFRIILVHAQVWVVEAGPNSRNTSVSAQKSAIPLMATPLTESSSLHKGRRQARPTPRRPWPARPCGMAA